MDINCKKSEIFIMQHFEKNIEPANAQRLTKHILVCPKCRELYLTMDDATIFEKNFFEKNISENAPENFTESVMEKVYAEKKYSPAASGQIILRIVWGISALILGIAFVFIEAITNALHSAGVFIGNAVEGISHNGAAFSAESIGFTALLFVAVMGILLYVLQNGEKVQT